MKIANHLFFIFILFSLCPVCSNAGGPLEIRKGKALSYGKRPVIYRYDKGKLGKLSNEEAVVLVEELFAKWEGVKTSSLRFVQDKPGFLNTDINSSNFSKILNSRSTKDLLGFTPIIFDEDGSLSDSYLGLGAGNGSLGFGGPVVIKKGNRYSITESRIVLNGRFINGINTKNDPEFDLELVKKTILHETGHAIGLDHSQINVEAIDPSATEEIKDSVPIMFPFGVNNLLEIRQDDASALSYLYPNKSELINFGSIQGKVFREDETTPVLGANVIARNIDNPKIVAISSVSDFLAKKSGSYIFFAIPPGDYTIEIEPINLELVKNNFSGGRATLGPYAKDLTDESFKDPVPKGFYTGQNQQITTDRNKALVVNVKPNQTLENINIIAKIND